MRPLSHGAVPVRSNVIHHQYGTMPRDSREVELLEQILKEMVGEVVSTFLREVVRMRRTERPGRCLSSVYPPHELLPRLFQKEMIRRNLVGRTVMGTSAQDSLSV